MTDRDQKARQAENIRIVTNMAFDEFLSRPKFYLAAFYTMDSFDRRTATECQNDTYEDIIKLVGDRVQEASESFQDYEYTSYDCIRFAEFAVAWNPWMYKYYNKIDTSLDGERKLNTAMPVYQCYWHIALYERRDSHILQSVRRVSAPIVSKFSQGEF